MSKSNEELEIEVRRKLRAPHGNDHMIEFVCKLLSSYSFRLKVLSEIEDRIHPDLIDLREKYNSSKLPLRVWVTTVQDGDKYDGFDTFRKMNLTSYCLMCYLDKYNGTNLINEEINSSNK